MKIKKTTARRWRCRDIAAAISCHTRAAVNIQCGKHRFKSLKFCNPPTYGVKPGLVVVGEYTITRWKALKKPGNGVSDLKTSQPTMMVGGGQCHRHVFRLGISPIPGAHHFQPPEFPRSEKQVRQSWLLICSPPGLMIKSRQSGRVVAITKEIACCAVNIVKALTGCSAETAEAALLVRYKTAIVWCAEKCRCRKLKTS